MGFSIRKRATYRWTVEHVVEKREGRPVTISFDAEFKALGQARVTELLKLAATLQIDDDTFLGEVLVGWHDGKDERTGEAREFPYSQENLVELREAYPGIVTSFSRAWTDSILGGGAARKN
jgi:hypothetical protein